MDDLKLGILGSGQLGWMMIQEGRKLPVKFGVMDSGEKGSAAAISDFYMGPDDYRKFVDSCDFVTYEFENVRRDGLEYAEEQGKLRPGLLPVNLKKDRSLEKDYLVSGGFPNAPFTVAETTSDARRSCRDFGKSVIKYASGGYDGKGQIYVRNEADIEKLEIHGKCIVEEMIDFDCEISVIGSRDSSGRVVMHTPSFNYNQSGILLYNYAPFPNRKAMEITSRLLNRLQYVGVIGVEFFLKGEDVIINEFAPRVHNTGHHTLSGSSISQFEQHVRTVLDLPVPDANLIMPSGIVNIIGRGIDSDLLHKLLQSNGTKVYWYGKNDARRKRKMGHVNLLAENENELREKISSTMELIYPDGVENYL
jgi:5-(carboxyamino)imidazole ribonucleotide synthase